MAVTPKSGAFALLGPVQPWMQATNGVIFPGDIGGPMCISNEYRWNVPVVTYGFDQSFSNYFGSNGATAVLGAIQILNDLPPASQIVLTNFPFYSKRINETAELRSLIDLKSETLSLLLEQMGLADPVRYIYVIRLWNPGFTNYPYLGQDNWPDGTVPTYIAPRNYDPITLDTSETIDSLIYSVVVQYTSYEHNILPDIANPTSPTCLAAADPNLNPGEYNYAGLTFDDVGGLAYLLSTNNVNYENLLPGVVGIGTNAGSLVNGARRPGVDKITFIPQPIDPQSGAFLATTNYYTDAYITNGVLQLQQVARVISQPDFLFSAGDVGTNLTGIVAFWRTSTTNWLNNAVANGSTNGAGPGVIQPQVQIVFNKLGRAFDAQSDEQAMDVSQSYGSFDGTTNPPISYPILIAATNELTVRMWLSAGNAENHAFEWKPISATGDQFVFQTSTNLTAWVNLFTVTNDGSVCTFFDSITYNNTSPRRFYRLIHQ